MRIILALAKALIIAGLCSLGALAILEGIGIPIPNIQYKGFVARDVPVGILLLVAGYAIARYWKIRIKEETTESHEWEDDESSGKSVKTTKSDVSFRPPGA